MRISIRTIVLIYSFLFVLAVPWYLPESTQRLFGMPIWVTVSLIVSLFISIFTAWLLLTMRWPDE